MGTHMALDTFRFTKRPSSIVTLAKAVKKRRVRYKKESFPSLSTTYKTTGIDRKHHAEYCRVCDVEPSDTMSLIYPLSLIYPFNIRLICSEDVPLVMFNMLNIHTSITSYRKINRDDPLDFQCHFAENRVLQKGLEVDIKSTITANGHIAWECVNTFYFRGKFRDPIDKDQSFYHKRIETPDDTFNWYLPNKNGLKFAGLSGDSNPLHFNRIYSVLMGFERDFAQPFLVSEKVFSLLGMQPEDRPVKVDLFYKGQVYYGKNQTIKRLNTGVSTLFEVFCDGNDRPSIHGVVAALP